MNNSFIFEAEPFEVSPEFQGNLDPELMNTESEEEFGRSRRIPMRQTGIRARPPRPFSASLRRPARPRPVVRPRPVIVRPRPRIIMPWSPLSVVREPSPYDQEPPGSEHVRWVQHSLNTVMGLQLPIDGVMRIKTRRAIGHFQEQQGLPITGIVDPQTEDALIAASGNQPPQTGDITAELTFEEDLDNFEEESYRVTKIYDLNFRLSSPLPLENKSAIDSMPTTPGLYFIYTGKRKQQRLWYIGKDQNSIRGRFQDRFKTFKDLNFSKECYEKCLQEANVQVRWLTISPRGSLPLDGILYKTKKTERWQPVTRKKKDKDKKKDIFNALVDILEMYYITKLKPPANEKNNKGKFRGPQVEFQDLGKININYPARTKPIVVNKPY